MAEEELLSEKWNKTAHFNHLLFHEQNLVKRLREELSDEKEEHALQVEARVLVEERLAKTEATIEKEREQKQKAESALGQTHAVLRGTETRLEKSEAACVDLTELLEDKEAEFHAYKAQAESDIAQLKDQLKEAAEEYELKEIEVDGVREKLQEARAEVAELTERCAEPEGEELERMVASTIALIPRHVRRAVDMEILQQVTDGKIELGEVNLPTLLAVGRLIRPRPRLKTVVQAVIFMIRLREGIDYPPEVEDVLVDDPSTWPWRGGDDRA